MTEFYIHIGWAKCGSTSIQNFLVANYKTFRKKYNFTVLNDKLKPMSRWPLSKRLSALPMNLRELANNSKSLTEVLLEKTPKYQKIIISAESLCILPVFNTLKGLDKHAKVNIICYLRRQDEFLTSSWKQWAMKKGVPINSFLENLLKIVRLNI